MRGRRNELEDEDADPLDPDDDEAAVFEYALESWRDGTRLLEVYDLLDALLELLGEEISS